MHHTNVVDVVRQLIAAENAKDAATADRLLAPDFIAITRSYGAEHNRAQLLKKIANPGVEFIRRIDGDPWVVENGTLAVVRSVIVIHDGSPPAEVRFRNTHVLKHLADGWQCLAWQVTKMVWPPENAV